MITWTLQKTVEIAFGPKPSDGFMRASALNATLARIEVFESDETTPTFRVRMAERRGGEWLAIEATPTAPTLSMALELAVAELVHRFGPAI